MPFTSSADRLSINNDVNQQMSDVPDTFPALVFDPAVAHPLTLPDGLSLREYMHIPKEARRAPLPRLYFTGSLVACLEKYQSMKTLLHALKDVTAFKSGGIHNMALAAFFTALNIISCLAKDELTASRQARAAGVQAIPRKSLAAMVQAIFPTFRFYRPRMTIFAVRRVSYLTLRAYMARDDRRRMRSAQAETDEVHDFVPSWSSTEVFRDALLAAGDTALRGELVVSRKEVIRKRPKRPDAFKQPRKKALRGSRSRDPYRRQLLEASGDPNASGI